MQHPLTRSGLGALVPCLTVLALVLALAAPCGAAALSGALDPTFGTGGKVTLPIAPGVKHDEAFAAVLDAQGRLLVGGYAALAGQQWALVRLLEDGSLDPTFGDGGGTVVIGFATPARVQALAVQDDGKIVAVGSSRQGTDDDVAVARLLADGDRDPGFGIGGTVVTSFSAVDDLARAVAVQPDGRIVVAGFARVGAKRDVALVRYLSDGTFDPSFGGTGMVALPIGPGNHEAYALALQEDGKILLAGYTTEASGQSLLVARVTASGALDPSFAGTGFVQVAFSGDGVARALALQPDGRILVAGGARVDGVPAFVAVRLAPDGTLDPTFGDGGKVATPIGGTAEGRAIALHPRGRFTVAGRARVDGKVSFAVAQYRANGTLDPTFGTGGIVTVPIGNRADEGYAIARRADGRIVVAGTTQTGSNRDFGVVRLLASDCGDGVLDAPAEQCDGDDLGGATCCSLECTVLAAGAECRPVQGTCDVPELCDGSSVSCPDDAFLPATTSCRPVQGVCDVEETCTGDQAACPEDAHVPAGVPCRASTGVCDAQETCDGVTATCPADAPAPAGTPCRASEGACDAAEACDGASTECPADLPAVAGTVCRAPSTACDAAETCDGLSFACPADALAEAGTPCRAASGVCDLTETCDGVSAECPADETLPDGDGDGTCDAFDLCPVDPDPAQSDGDGDGLGDACDPCTGGVALRKAVFRFGKLATPPGDDTVMLKGRLLFDPARPPIDPRTNGMRLIIEDAQGARLYDVELPSGPLGGGSGPGWRVKPTGSAYVFKSPTSAGGLVRRVRVKLPPAKPRRIDVRVDGHGLDLSHMAAAAAPLRAIVVVDPLGASAGHCAEAAPACTTKETALVCR